MKMFSFLENDCGETNKKMKLKYELETNMKNKRFLVLFAC